MFQNDPTVINCDLCGSHLATDPRITFRMGYSFCENCVEANQELRDLIASRSSDPQFYLRVALFVAANRRDAGSQE